MDVHAEGELDPELDEDQFNEGDEEEADEVMEEVDDQEGYTSSTPTSNLTWISWFCSLPGHEYFCEVAEDFIEDDFNLTGLSPYVPFWKEALEMVLDVDPDEDSSKIPDVSIVEQSAEILYGLVHSRYILTRAGLSAMIEKYEQGMFGACPRVFCMGTHIVPCGRTDLPSLDTVKLFCPNCNDIYSPPSSRFQSIDAAYFGTTFPHLFFQSYRELCPAPFWKPSSSGGSSMSPGRSPRSGSDAANNPNPHGGQKRAAGYVYIPRIYGFKVSERAKSGPRMQWLRIRPEGPEELDHVDWRGRWVDEEDDYDDDDDEEEEGEDRRMEDFDPDAVEDDDDEEEEEEEEEEGSRGGHSGQRRAADDRPPTPIDSWNIPTAGNGTTNNNKKAMSLPLFVQVPTLGGGGGKVRVVRGYTGGNSYLGKRLSTPTWTEAV